MTRGQLAIIALGFGIALGVLTAAILPWLAVIYVPIGLVGLWFVRRRAS